MITRKFRRFSSGFIQFLQNFWPSTTQKNFHIFSSFPRKWATLLVYVPIFSKKFSTIFLGPDLTKNHFSANFLVKGLIFVNFVVKLAISRIFVLFWFIFVIFPQLSPRFSVFCHCVHDPGDNPPGRLPLWWSPGAKIPPLPPPPPFGPFIVFGIGTQKNQFGPSNCFVLFIDGQRPIPYEWHNNGPEWIIGHKCAENWAKTPPKIDTKNLKKFHRKLI